MTVETYFRFLFTMLAIGLTILVIHNLVTGRTRFLAQSVARSRDPRLYWGTVGQQAILAAALGIGAALPIAHSAAPSFMLGLFGGQLFNLLVSGRNPRGGPATLGWLIFLPLVVLGGVALLLFP